MQVSRNRNIAPVSNNSTDVPLEQISSTTEHPAWVGKRKEASVWASAGNAASGFERHVPGAKKFYGWFAARREGRLEECKEFATVWLKDWKDSAQGEDSFGRALKGARLLLESVDNITADMQRSGLQNHDMARYNRDVLNARGYGCWVRERVAALCSQRVAKIGAKIDAAFGTWEGSPQGLSDYMLAALRKRANSALSSTTAVGPGGRYRHEDE